MNVRSGGLSVLGTRGDSAETLQDALLTLRDKRVTVDLDAFCAAAGLQPLNRA
ncbi:hypothetical protein [Cryobacterium sp. SO1]|uniref:hypothetical protein n=1 Tax=Cryobacterium sp. SO1 TaxID=1897061 RepID=UPI0013EE57E6|nr:hypothetical protein [Cryobacterium sp. SO1]